MKDEFSIRQLNENDAQHFIKLIEVFSEVFENVNNLTAPFSHLQTLLSNSTFIALVILYNDEVIGGLTAYELPMYYCQSSEIFIYDIAVLKKFQRKGLGKRLINEIKKIAQQRNVAQIFVAANEEDKQAVDFYKTTKGVSERVIHFTYRLEK